MDIFVKTPTGHKFTFQVFPSDTILTIKHQIRGTSLNPWPSHLLPEYQHLYKQESETGEGDVHSENELRDDFSLQDYNILPGAMLIMKSDMTISVRTEDDLLFTFPVEPLNTIHDLKVNIFKETGIRMDRQNMFYASKRDPDGSYYFKIPLKDSWTLKICNFENEKLLLVEVIGSEKEKASIDNIPATHHPISYWMDACTLNHKLSKIINCLSNGSTVIFPYQRPFFMQGGNMTPLTHNCQLNALMKNSVSLFSMLC